MQVGVPLGGGRGGKTCGQGDGQSPAQGVGNTGAPPGEGRGPEAMSWELEDAHSAICSLGTPLCSSPPSPASGAAIRKRCGFLLSVSLNPPFLAIPTTCGVRLLCGPAAPDP